MNENIAKATVSTVPPTPAPLAPEDLPSSEARILVASPRQLMWWRFRRHRIAVVGTIVVILFYLVAIFCEFIAPANPDTIDGAHKYVPPQQISFIDANGNFTFRPGVYGLSPHRDPVTLRLSYTSDPKQWYPIYFFSTGPDYKLWGLIPSNVHLIGLGPNSDQPFFLLGSDRLGRDMLSRIVYAARISLSIGLVGVTLSLILGIILGGISGLYGGTADIIIQRVIEFLRSMPTIPLWLALAAALPPQWSPLYVYFGITCILSLIGWTRLAREVRGRFIALREEDFVLAARLCGSSQMRIIWRHMVPSFLSHIIAVITLAIPGMILSETALSFLGLGLRPPVISWGVLLQDAQNVQTVAIYPWLLLPGVAVVIVILAFNFMGDGLRDAADPYGR
ncbi:MAG TPA: ABC transporter permease [Chloroflexota bacterium]|nr:ABC transporter permease [Chloroflexota bacterium]